MQYLAAFSRGRTLNKFASILVLGLALKSNVQAAPLTFNTALPISEGEYIIREQFVINKSGDDPSGMDRERTERLLASTLVYGVNPDLALFGTLPYTDRKLESNTNTRSTNGIGDSRVFARYTIFKDDFVGGTFRIAPFAGVKLPTGEDDKQDSLGTLPMSVQTGTGSWDVFGGLVATYGSTNWEIDGQISYQANTEAHDFEAGDIARADVSLQYRLIPTALSSNSDYFLNGIIETNIIHQDKHKVDGNDNPNSGGTVIFLVPGLQYAAERYIAELGVQVPIVQDLNGTALENEYIFRVGFRVNF
jgi:Putative MetA-pathway of phenol degradation